MAADTSGFLGDLKILWHLTMTRARGQSHQERLESFYRGQASGYDAFRRRLLHGRDEMIQEVPLPADGVWVDLGAGTGENAERLGPRLSQLRKMYLVDLCPALLEVATHRITARQWTNVAAVHADATTFRPDEGAADVVTFSYSLTMIPDWFRAMEHARGLLRPGGIVGVVDFYVSRKHASEGRRQHGWLTRHFWPTWFSTDNVFLNPDHVPYLESRFDTLLLHEKRGKVPYLPLGRVPYYIFIGRKPAE